MKYVRTGGIMDAKRVTDESIRDLGKEGQNNEAELRV
jgi:hypothetical protein